MNDAARELLVKAALAGHPQGIESWHSAQGDCAQGVLHLECHAGDRVAADHCQHEWLGGACAMALRDRYHISDTEWAEIARRNDRGEDFLTIARKVGHDGTE